MSRLQNIARARNSAKGRIKGLRNNIRGMLDGDTSHLTEDEVEDLAHAQVKFDMILQDWDENYEKIKFNL